MTDIKQELSGLEREKSLILENSPLLIAYQNIDHEVIWANERAGKSVDEDPSDLEGGKCFKIWHEREKPCDDCPVEESWKTGESQTGEIRSPDGRFWEITGNPMKDDEGNVIGAVEITSEITERKKTKEKLKESEERYRRLFETAQDGMLIIDAETGIIEDANPFIQDILAYSKEELVGKELWELGTFESVVENKRRFEELVEEGYIRYEDKPLVTKDGKEVPVEFVSNSYEAGGKKVVQCNIREISERKKAEEREEFLHSLFRHDIKNKNQIIKGYLELMKDFELSDEVKNFVDKALYSTKESLEMIEKIRKLRRIEEEDETRELDLNSLMNKVLSKHQNQLQEKGINIDTGECKSKVKGGALLEELFSNLIENSIQHSDCDEIRIHSKTEENECVVTVEDDGLDISGEMKDEIFDKGFKKGESAGTGLGLYMVKEIVESYGGSIEVEDSEMGGVRFEVGLKRTGGSSFDS